MLGMAEFADWIFFDSKPVCSVRSINTGAMNADIQMSLVWWVSSDQYYSGRNWASVPELRYWFVLYRLSGI